MAASRRILRPPVLFHGPFELDGGFVGKVGGGAFVEGIGKFWILGEQNVAEEEGLGGGAGGFGEDGEDGGGGLVELAVGEEGFGAGAWLGADGWRWRHGCREGKSGAGGEARMAVREGEGNGGRASSSGLLPRGMRRR